ncbi:MAG: hypothetical protein R2831_02365 [Chitinophagaceae bacterium]
MMGYESINIFNVKPVSFDQGERDPFGFDDFSEKVGADYLPFSGSVSKPTYYLFVAYVNHFLNTNKSLWKNDKQKREIQIRLEKLLVYCWKSKFSKTELRGGLLGNNFELSVIDVFTSKGWVIQNAFKIYTDRNFAPATLELYLKKVGERQMPLLRDFILCDYKLPQRKAEYIKDLVKQLQKKNSLFNNHRLEDFKDKFKKELIEKIKGRLKNEYFQLLQPYFTYKTFKEETFWSKLLENPNPKIPFAFLNNWFGKFVLAVDADIYNKPNRKSLWINADKAFEEIPNNYLSSSKSDITLQKRMKKSKWFQFNTSENRYAFYDKGSPSEKRRIENLWESYKKRQGEEEGTSYFFNYRHSALLRLIKELR